MEKNENFVDIHVSFDLNDLDKLAESLAKAMVIMIECDQKIASKKLIHDLVTKAFGSDETETEDTDTDTDETETEDTDTDTDETETADTETEVTSSMSDWD